jgi:surfeit locus 1 family protein
MDAVIPLSKDAARLPGKEIQGGSVRIKIVCLLLSASLLPSLLGLGLWQLQRAEAKRNLIQQAKDAPVTLNLAQQPRQLPGRVELQVRLLSNQLLLLDNRTRAGSVGYELLSVFQDTGSERWGIVNLGWIPAGADRTLLPQLPPLPDLEQQISLRGMQVSAQPGFMLGADLWQPGWPKIIQQPDMARFEQLFERPLYPAIIRLTEPTVALTDTHWDLVVMPPEKHLGYAVQWFALALALALWLLWFGWWRTDPSDSKAQDL